ncbi:MAG: hypothetical protein IKW71_03535 [Elusimicrobiaceae bacterium]|nr:hypothetical protein [Elusimicrobiaceae bacterium]
MYFSKGLKVICTLALMLCFAPCAWGIDTFTQTCKDALVTTWTEGKLELIIPANTWHNRSHYTHEQIEKYNERPWGIGLAKTYIDPKANRHRLLALVFQDSFNRPEPTFGYSWQAVWRAEHILRPTLGFVAGVTFRDSYDWIPIPAAIPIAGVDIGPFSLETTYLLGFDVLFTWVTWRF